MLNEIEFYFEYNILIFVDLVNLWEINQECVCYIIDCWEVFNGCIWYCFCVLLDQGNDVIDFDGIEDGNGFE